MSEEKLYNIFEAADYLGTNLENLRYRIYKVKHLRADRRFGRILAFYQSTLDEFRRKHQAEGLTLAEAALYLGVTENWVHNHVWVSKKLQPVGKRGRNYVFSIAAVEAMKPLVKEGGKVVH